MLKVKPSVRPRNLYIAAACINVAIDWHLADDITITSGIDGVHSPGSLHKKGNALDIRIKIFDSIEEKEEFIKRVLKRLGKDYQGFLEDFGKPNEHFHFEYDPK